MGEAFGLRGNGVDGMWSANEGPLGAGCVEVREREREEGRSENEGVLDLLVCSV